MAAARRPRWIQLGAIGRDEQRSSSCERRGERGEKLLRSRIRPLHLGQREDHWLRASDAKDEIADGAVEELAARLAGQRRQGQAVAESG